MSSHPQHPAPRYTLAWRDTGGYRHEQSMPDPFVTTRITVRGWRNALRVLFRRYEATVRVDADPLTVERVLHLNPDYLPTRGPRRDEFNRQLHEALGAVAGGGERAG